MTRPAPAPRHVVVVNDFGHVEGGASRVAVESALALAATGRAVTFFCAVAPIAPALREQRNLRVVCTAQHDVLGDPSRGRAIVQGLWNRRAARALAEVLSATPVAETVVHLHGWTKALSASAVAAAFARGSRIVCTMHDYFLACPNGGFFDYQAGRICLRRPLSAACVARHCDIRSYPQKLWRTGRQVVQRSAGLPSRLRHVIAVSELSAGVLRPFLPPATRVHLVRNPVAAVREPPVDVARHDLFVAVGRLSPEKGPRLFATAAARSGCAALFVGDGACRAEVARICPGARVTGWLPPAEVAAHVRRARALVLPSLWYEAQPLAVLEAAALGVPALVPDGCAAREAVADGETGLWFRSGDPDDLARKLEQLGDAGTARRMGRAAYERFWSDPPTLETHAADLLRVYAEVVGP